MTIFDGLDVKNCLAQTGFEKQNKSTNLVKHNQVRSVIIYLEK